ncbi:hypothetical protein NPIL_702361 [Nephila pilipes]|uniref:Uncharacterized protein n=1 Tax=Nephila pilipes TaxID=299642 RepID=A0A8X6NDW2_NEPPI|nr:hypothetical protein NPIL_702361 [Nephila pilipes]
MMDTWWIDHHCMICFLIELLLLVSEENRATFRGRDFVFSGCRCSHHLIETWIGIWLPRTLYMMKWSNSQKVSRFLPSLPKPGCNYSKIGMRQIFF